MREFSDDDIIKMHNVASGEARKTENSTFEVDYMRSIISQLKEHGFGDVKEAKQEAYREALRSTDTLRKMPNSIWASGYNAAINEARSRIWSLTAPVDPRQPVFDEINRLAKQMLAALDAQKGEMK